MVSYSQARVLQVAHWVAPVGGLQQHLLVLLGSLGRNGWPCALAGPCSPFLSAAEGVATCVLGTDFAAAESDRIAALVPRCQLVHVHPGPSVGLGLEVAAKLRVPAVMTVHGDWMGGLEKRYAVLARVFAVSKAAAARAIAAGMASERIIYTPNTADRAIFVPLSPAWLELRRTWRRALQRLPLVVCATRWFADKRVFIDMVTELVRQTRSAPRLKWRLAIVGDGPLREPIEDELRRLAVRHGPGASQSLRWLSQVELAALYREADCVIAAGRSAIDALSVGTRLVALGSAGLLGFVDRSKINRAVATNMGDHGSPGAEKDLMAELRVALASSPATYARFAAEAYREHYLPYEDNVAVVAAYEELCGSKAAYCHGPEMDPRSGTA
jgi:glycosyltransferase involved in cell wall biosynthesis